MVELARAEPRGGDGGASSGALQDLLAQFQAPPDPKQLAQRLVVLARQVSGCEAAAVRLKVGEDYPYAAFLGFPEPFITLENELCSRGRDGHLVQDNHHRPVLACQCGRVLSGQVDSSHAHFTPMGSLVIGSHSELKCQDRTRRCQLVGYETMGLFPIRSEGATYGLIQCNDPRPGVLTADRTSLLEGLATSAALLLGKTMG
jgi:GAF domain